MFFFLPESFETSIFHDLSELNLVMWLFKFFIFVYSGKMGLFWKRIHMLHQGTILISELFPSVKTLLLELKVVMCLILTTFFIKVILPLHGILVEECI